MLAAERQLQVASSLTPPPASRCAMHPDDFDELRASLTYPVVVDGVEIVKACTSARFMGVEVYTDPRVPRGSVAFDGPPPTL